MRTENVVKNWEGNEMSGKNRFRSEMGLPRKEYYKYIYLARSFRKIIRIEIIMRCAAV